MLPLFPYNGLLRPALMLVGMGLAFLVLYRTRERPCHGKLLCLACLGYAFFLLYATFLSRSVAQFYSYRLELMQSARNAFRIDGGLWSLVRGDFAAIRLDDPQSLEGILINLLLMAPAGYLLPMVAAARGKAVRGWQVILCGAVLSATIEIIQLITRLGMLDVDDWVFNTLGTVMGYALYRHFFEQVEKTSGTP